LSARLGEKLITGDERLYNAAHSRLDWVLWTRDFDERESKETPGR
jgi:hypothetical protein